MRNSVHQNYEAAVLARIADIVESENFGLRNDGVAGGSYFRSACETLRNRGLVVDESSDTEPSEYTITQSGRERLKKYIRNGQVEWDGGRDGRSATKEVVLKDNWEQLLGE